MEIAQIINAIFGSLTNIIAAIVILVLTFLAFFGLFKSENPKIKHFAQQSPAILATVGIFFSFWGISISLIGLDLNDIQNSIPKLLDGLKIKFIASLMGIGASIIIRIAQSFDIKEAIIDDYSAAILQEIRRQNELLLLTNKYNKEHAELINYSINSGFKNQILRFDEFSESVTKNGTEALIQAIQEVMRDFNSKINEQFGDNFKQLNQAVGELLIWQDKYKSHVEKLDKNFKLALESINIIVTSFENIKTHAQGFTRISEKFGENIDLFEIQTKEIKNIISSSSEMFNNLNGELKKSNVEITKMSDNLLKNQSKSDEEMANLLSKMSSSFVLVSKKFIADYENVTDLLTQINTALKNK